MSKMDVAKAAFSTARNLTNSAMSGDIVGAGHAAIDGILSQCETLRTTGDRALKQIAQQQAPTQQGQAPTQGHEQEQDEKRAR